MVKLGSFPLLVIALASCASVADKPRLTSAEVVRLADAEARRHDYDLRLYERPKLRYNVHKDNTWSVSYDERPVNGMVHIGFDFRVYINDQTKEIWLIPGR
jgi:hypothetical protein